MDLVTKRPLPIINGRRECRSCRVIRPLSEFWKHKKCHQGYSPTCKVCGRAANKAWRLANPDKQRYQGSWQQRNPQWRQKNLSDKYRALKQQILLAYGLRCNQCGFSDVRALHIDHVHENGAADRRRFTALQRMTAIIRLGFPHDYQLLCANCNTIKACEAGTLRFTPAREAV